MFRGQADFPLYFADFVSENSYIFTKIVLNKFIYLELSFGNLFFCKKVNFQTKKAKIPAKGLVNITLLGIVFIIYFVP